MTDLRAVLENLVHACRFSPEATVDKRLDEAEAALSAPASQPAPDAHLVAAQLFTEREQLRAKVERLLSALSRAKILAHDLDQANLGSAEEIEREIERAFDAELALGNPALETSTEGREGAEAAGEGVLNLPGLMQMPKRMEISVSQGDTPERCAENEAWVTDLEAAHQRIEHLEVERDALRRRVEELTEERRVLRNVACDWDIKCDKLTAELRDAKADAEKGWAEVTRLGGCLRDAQAERTALLEVVSRHSAELIQMPSIAMFLRDAQERAAALVEPRDRGVEHGERRPRDEPREQGQRRLDGDREASLSLGCKPHGHINCSACADVARVEHLIDKKRRADQALANALDDVNQLRAAAFDALRDWRETGQVSVTAMTALQEAADNAERQPLPADPAPKAEQAAAYCRKCQGCCVPESCRCECHAEQAAGELPPQPQPPRNEPQDPECD